MQNHLLQSLTKFLISFTGISVILFFVISCTATTKELEHTWYDYSYEIENNQFPDSKDISYITTFNKSIFKFYPNGKLVTLLRDKGYFVGKWEKINDQNSFLISGDFLEKPIKFKVDSTLEDYTKFVILNEENNPTNLFIKMVRGDKSFLINSVDLLEDNEKNQWWIRPKQPENDLQLKKRCYEMLSYSIDYLAMSINNQKSTVGSFLMQSPFEMYDGAVTLASRDNLPQSWVNTFYNINDAIKAHEMLSDAFKSTEYPSNSESNNKAYLTVLKETRYNLGYNP
jgi:hypothetical protein